MVGTGVPKWVSVKLVRWIIVFIFIAVAALVAWSYIRAVFGELIDYPIKGEKARFMRYMACAIAMCDARDTLSACDNDKVMGLEVDQDEDGNPISCQTICLDVENSAAARGLDTPLEYYCDQNIGYAINFTFQSDVRYNANYDIKGIMEGGTPEISCEYGKTGWQTDASCTSGWETKGIIDCGCLSCMPTAGGVLLPLKVKSVRPVGKLKKNPDGCGVIGGDDSGTIWFPESMVTDGKCVEDTERGELNLAYCQFDEGDTIQIWAEESNPSRYNCFDVPIIGKCWGTSLSGLPYHRCHQIAICET